MRVTFKPQISNQNLSINQNQDYKKANATVPSKMDSISFTSSKFQPLKGIAGEMAEVINGKMASFAQKTKKSDELKQSFLENFSFTQSANLKELEALRLDFDESFFSLKRKTTQYKGIFGKNKEFSEYFIAKPVKQEKISEETYNFLSEKLQAFARPLVLEKYGYKGKSPEEIIQAIAQGLVNKKVQLGNARHISDEKFCFNNNLFEMDDDFTIGIVHNEHYNAYKMLFTRLSDSSHESIINLTSPKEVSYAQNLLKIADYASKIQENLKSKKSLEKVAEEANLKLKNLELKINTENKEAEKEMQSLFTTFSNIK